MKYILLSVLGLLLGSALWAQEPREADSGAAADVLPEVLVLGCATDAGTAADRYLGGVAVTPVTVDAESAEAMARRIREGEFKGLQPQMILMVPGLKRDRRLPAKPWVCARAFGDLIYLIRSRLPGVKIVLTSFLPSDTAALRQPIRNTNRLLETLADGDEICFVDVADVLSLPGGGRIDPALFNSESGTLTAEGRRRLAACFRPMIDRLQGAAAEDRL